jgi:mono/diheme cytochrome c family protein
MSPWRLFHSFRIIFLLKRIVIGLISIGVVGLVGFVAFAWRTAIAPITPPQNGVFAPELIAKGEVLAGAGYCATCHTAKGGAPFAGNLPMETSFGTIYSTNITPDPETGIGRWSEAAFKRAMHEGVARDGAHLFPAFPFDHFTKLSAADISALYAFIMTRQPVHTVQAENTIPFPLNIRLLQAGWKLLFFRSGEYQPDAGKNAQWNRGAYLAEGISHCGACHTPRNPLGAEETSRQYAGAAIDGWIAPALTAENRSPVPLTEEEFYAYLRNGISTYHGVAAGPMSPVVHDGLAKLPDTDIHALAVYLADKAGSATRLSEIKPAIDKALASEASVADAQQSGAARLYTSACGACHYNSGKINALRPDLGLNSAVHLADPTNLIHVILDGVSAKDGASGIVMPAFRDGLSDADIANIAAYLRKTRTDKAPWPDLEKAVATIRAHGSEQK